jgi:hypothetical protein
MLCTHVFMWCVGLCMFMFCIFMLCILLCILCLCCVYFCLVHPAHSCCRSCILQALTAASSNTVCCNLAAHKHPMYILIRTLLAGFGWGTSRPPACHYIKRCRAAHVDCPPTYVPPVLPPPPQDSIQPGDTHSMRYQFVSVCTATYC